MLIVVTSMLCIVISTGCFTLLNSLKEYIIKPLKDSDIVKQSNFNNHQISIISQGIQTKEIINNITIKIFKIISISAKKIR